MTRYGTIRTNSANNSGKTRKGNLELSILTLQAWPEVLRSPPQIGSCFVRRFIGLLLLTVWSCWNTAAQGALVVGDVAIIAFGADKDDEFAWVALSNISANTTINFTDNSWQATAPVGFRTSEHGVNPLTWTHTSSIAAGTVIRYTGRTTNAWTTGTRGGSGMALSSRGDQIFVFTGTTAAPTLIYGIDFAHAAPGWIPNNQTVTDNNSHIPGGLTSGSTAVYLGNFDNAYYSGAVTSGTKAQLLALLANPTNWTGNNGQISSANWKTAFNVTAPTAAPEPSAMILAGLAMLTMAGIQWRRRHHSPVGLV